MELKFENCCTLDRAALLAMNRCSRNPVFTAAAIVIGAAYLFNGVRAAIAGYPAGLIAPVICAALLGLFAYYLPNMQASAEFRKNRAAYGRDANCITKFYEDKFVVENLSSGRTTSIPYARIRKVTESEDFYFLLLDTRIISPVDKRDFLVGTAEGFGEFIRAKATNTTRRGAKPDNAL